MWYSRRLPYAVEIVLLTTPSILMALSPTMDTTACCPVRDRLAGLAATSNPSPTLAVEPLRASVAGDATIPRPRLITAAEGVRDRAWGSLI